MADVDKKWRLGRIAMCVSAWYVSSLFTLFMNKWYLLEESGLGGSPQTLALAQTVFSAMTGAARHFSDSLSARDSGDDDEDSKKEKSKTGRLGGGVHSSLSKGSLIKNVLSRISSKSAPPRAPRSMGSLPLKHPFSSDRASSNETKIPVGRKAFLRQMFALGTMRFGTVVLGLVALEHLAVSFTETIKSSAPFVTAVFAFVLLDERTPTRVLLSLVPIVLGLALCSFTEASFNAAGFAAAMMCNCVDCIQNVYSKKLLRHYKPVQLQFYASAAALCVQVPLVVAVRIYNAPVETFSRVYPATARLDPPASAVEVVRSNAPPYLSAYAASYLAVNGLFFYVQSVSAYGLMDLVSPVTHSVCNCVKRALLIWLSVLFWKNRVGLLNAAGTAVLLGGVLMYNHRVREHQRRLQMRTQQHPALRDEHEKAVRKSKSPSSLPFHV